MLSRGFLAFLPLLAGCEGLFRPSGDSITIEHEQMAIDDATLLVGERLRFTARSSGSSERAVVWTSSDPAVARVSGTGEVLGIGAGSARVVATRRSLADTVHLTVFAAPPADGFCAEGGLELERGEAFTTTAAAADRLCLRGGDRNRIFVLVPFHAASAGSTLPVEVAAEGIGDGSLLRQLDGPSFSATPLPATTDGPIRSAAADRALREREARELTPLVSGAARLAPAAPLRPAVLPTIGDTLVLNVNPDRTCTDPRLRRASVVAVSDRAIVLHDVLNPPGAFTSEEYAAFAELFDDLVYPTVVENFGEPTDIDGNGRVLIAFTTAVNQMTRERATEYIAGFFYARDLFPKTDSAPLAGCDGSNAAELLYMMTPDPSGTINRNVRSKRFVAERTGSVLAHELQHLINASRRLRVIGAPDWSEEFWLNEGLSHVAEELVFYAAAGIGPGREVSGTHIRGGLSEPFAHYQAVNLSRYSTFLRAVGATSVFSGADLAHRGASWSFLRYGADRMSGDDRTLWRALVDSRATGYANLAGALQTSPLAWMHDWAVSFYTDDFIPVEDRFRQPSWNFRSLLPTLAVGSSGYPLEIHHVVDRAPSYRGSLVAGGAAILRFSVPTGGTAALRTTSNGVVAPSKLRLTVVRTW